VVEQRRSHLGAARVVHADEKNFGNVVHIERLGDANEPQVNDAGRGDAKGASRWWRILTSYDRRRHNSFA
jgi:hypothetical protein